MNFIQPNHNNRNFIQPNHNNRNASGSCCTNKHVNKNRKPTGNCVCDVLVKLVESQKEDSTVCTQGCFPPKGRQSQIIPFLLVNKSGGFLTSFGFVPNLNVPGNRFSCFTTVFFRVVSVDIPTCCAVLELLQPDQCLIDGGAANECCVPLSEICDVDALFLTGICINVDLDCFCAVNCLDPDLILSAPTVSNPRAFCDTP
jgi:hypothetical protein